MNTKRLIKIILGGMIACVAIAIMFAPKHYANVAAEYASFAGPANPVMLSIDRIGMRAMIQPVGVADDNEMAVPTNPDLVGWYRFGTRPGDTGSAVLAGHVNWIHNADAAFTHLHDVQIDDVVSVTDDYGAVDYFIVRDIKRYRPDDDTSEVFLSDDTPRLNLITCDGLWNTLLGTHENRLVVFTEKI